MQWWAWGLLSAFRVPTWKLSARDGHVARGVRELGSHETMSSVSLGVSSFLGLSREEPGVERLSFTELDLHSRARRE